MFVFLHLAYFISIILFWSVYMVGNGRILSLSLWHLGYIWLLAIGNNDGVAYIFSDIQKWDNWIICISIFDFDLFGGTSTVTK